MEIVMFIGIPATGKFSFYQDRFAASHLRINRDMLKTEVRFSSLFFVRLVEAGFKVESWNHEI
jgi:hypothetical protein